MTSAGNKRYLPARACAACGRPMVWRRRWAKNWSEVRYCSERCRGGRRLAPARQSR